MTSAAWVALVAHLSEVELLDGTKCLLSWDEQTHMPRKAAALRGAQVGLLARLSHERLTDPRVARWLGELDRSDPVQAACARNLGRLIRRERRVPPALIDQLARARSAGFQAWLDAKARADFRRFAPALERVLELSLQRATAIDPGRHPYEVQLEETDPGTSVAELSAMFTRLRRGLAPLLEAIAGRPQWPSLQGSFEVERQRALSREVAVALGYDFEAGRIDHAEHPFSAGVGAGDVRITNHLDPCDVLGGLTGTIHETGHALYELGLPETLAGTTVRDAASAGLHESQSRFWENFIGRSPPFARWLAGLLARHFPADAPSVETLVRALNRVEPGLVRISADEVTYNLHIIVRFELELALFERRLSVRELPEAWNEKMREILGLAPPDDASGVLQDAHWSDGTFAYFPSYTLGNLYAASLGAAMGEQVADLWEQVEQGSFGPALRWLREHVHRRGHLLEAPEIVRAAVGERDSVEDLLSHLWRRHGTLYGVERPHGPDAEAAGSG
jgi:carboxypeptidase Taq